jgi:hypothetical protein
MCEGAYQDLSVAPPSIFMVLVTLSSFTDSRQKPTGTVLVLHINSVVTWRKKIFMFSVYFMITLSDLESDYINSRQVNILYPSD